MTKRVADLTFAELAEAGGQAWNAAAQDTLNHGLPVTGSYNGRRFRYHPDGRIEDLGPIDATPDDSAGMKQKKRSRQAVA